jgi:hypothetical protein
MFQLTQMSQFTSDKSSFTGLSPEVRKVRKGPFWKNRSARCKGKNHKAISVQFIIEENEDEILLISR